MDSKSPRTKPQDKKPKKCRTCDRPAASCDLCDSCYQSALRMFRSGEITRLQAEELGLIGKSPREGRGKSPFREKALAAMKRRGSKTS